MISPPSPDPSVTPPVELHQATLSLALQYLQVGEWRQAEQLCQQILATQPDQPDAHHLLSLIRLRSGRPQAALSQIETAIQLHDQNPEFFCHRGVIYRILGREGEAIESYRQALSLDPDYVDAHFNLGNVQIAIDHPQPAKACYQRVLEIDPSHAEACCQLGTLFDREGDSKTAEDHYRRALHLDPGLSEAHFNLGDLLRRHNHDQPALAHYRAALTADPHYLPAQINLAQMLKQQGQLEEAMDLFQQVLPQISSGRGDLCAQLADCYAALGQWDQALEYLRQATQANPRQPQHYLTWSQILVDQGRWQEAIEVLQEGVDLNPDRADLVMQAAQILIRKGELGDGAACLEHVIQLDPHQAKAYFQLGAIYFEVEDLTRAEQHLRAALQVNAGSPQMLELLGKILAEQDRLSEAIQIYQQGLNLAPERASLHIGLGQVLMKTGDLEQGLSELEWRISKDAGIPGLPPDRLWSGEVLSGKQILLHHHKDMISHSSLGELLLWLRLIPELVKQGAQISVLRPTEAFRFEELLKQIPGVSEIIHELSDHAPFDVHCPIIGLPQRLGISSPTLPWQIPYLHPDQKQSDQIQHRMGKQTRAQLQVGIVHTPQSWDRLSAREWGYHSCPLPFFLRLLSVPGLQLWGFSPLSDQDQAALDLQLGFTDLSSELTTLGEAAGWLQQMDLVISVDTAYAHLAAALGRPTWILLPTVGHWIWLQEPSNCPWYPSVRLFRQARAGEWQGIFQQITWRIRALLAGE